MTLNDYAHLCHSIAAEKGFWTDQYSSRTQTEMRTIRALALITSEVSEAIEALRKNDAGLASTEFSEEIADILIRTFDLAGALCLDLNEIVNKKIQKNRLRPAKHGKRF